MSAAVDKSLSASHTKNLTPPAMSAAVDKSLSASHTKNLTPPVHRHRFETQQHASRVIAEWIRFYNTRRPHQALGMKTPAMAYALAA
jgi:putative transposase